MKPTFETVGAALLSNAHAVCSHLLPGGIVVGNEYQCGDLRGGKGQSCKVNLQDGVWKDFAAGPGGSDLVALWAAVHGIEQGDARDQAAAWVGIAYQQAVAGDMLEDNPVIILDERRPVGEWVYRDDKGEPAFKVVRYDVHGKKDIRQQGWNPDLQAFESAIPARYKGTRPELRPLFHLAELKDADSIVVAEGEKCVDALNDAGFIATTSSGGAGNFHHTDWGPLRDKEVVIWCDNDEPGVQWREQLTIHLRDDVNAKAIYYVTPVEIKGVKGADAADCDEPTIRGLIGRALEARPAFKRVPALFEDECIMQPSTLNVAETKWLVPDLIPMGELSLFVSSPGIGKSYTLTDLAMKVALPVDSLRTDCKFMGSHIGREMHGHVVQFSFEESMERANARLVQIVGTYDAALEVTRDTNKRWRYKSADLVQQYDPSCLCDFVRRDRQTNAWETTPFFDEFYRQCLQIPDLKLITIDPLTSAIMGEVLDNYAIFLLMSRLKLLAAETGAAVVCAHHFNKSANILADEDSMRQAMGGATPMLSSPRHCFGVAKTEEVAPNGSPVLKAIVFKSNLAKSTPPVLLVRDADSGVLIESGYEVRSHRKMTKSRASREIIRLVGRAAANGTHYQNGVRKHASIWARRKQTSDDPINALTRSDCESLLQYLIDHGEITVDSKDNLNVGTVRFEDE